MTRDLQRSFLTLPLSRLHGPPRQTLVRSRTTGVHATFEVRSPQHAAAVVAAAAAAGFADLTVETQ